MKRLLALVLCVLVLLTMSCWFAGCSKKDTTEDKHNHIHNTIDNSSSNVSTTTTLPAKHDPLNPQEDKDTPFLGTWKVTSEESTLRQIVVYDSGAIHASFDGGSLGGVFYDDGETFKMVISQRTIEGKYVIGNGVITLTTEDDVLTFEKVKTE